MISAVAVASLTLIGFLSILAGFTGKDISSLKILSGVVALFISRVVTEFQLLFSEIENERNYVYHLKKVPKYEMVSNPGGS